MLKYGIYPKINPMNKSTKYYGVLIPVMALTMDEIADEISLQNTVTRHDIKCVVSALQEHIGHALLNGRSVRFGTFGSFRPTLDSKGATEQKLFTSKMIRGIRVRFTPSSRLEYELSTTNPMVKFECVTPKTDTGGGDAIV